MFSTSFSPEKIFLIADIMLKNGAVNISHVIAVLKSKVKVFVCERISTVVVKYTS